MAIKRPKEIDQYKTFDAEEKAAKGAKEKIKEKVRGFLRNSDYPDVRLIEVNTEKIDNDTAMAWAEDNLTEEQYKSLFVRYFDANAFSEMIKDGLVSKKAMIKLGILTKTTRHDIRVYHEKEVE